MTQTQKFINELKKLKPDVTPADISYVNSKYNHHPNTVRNYLNGDVKNNDIAYDILLGLKERFAQREKAFA